MGGTKAGDLSTLRTARIYARLRELLVSSSCESAQVAWSWPITVVASSSFQGMAHGRSNSTLFNAGGAITVKDTLASPYLSGLEHSFSMANALELNVLGSDVQLPPSISGTVGNTARPRYKREIEGVQRGMVRCSRSTSTDT
jgi:hypothetical protein